MANKVWKKLSKNVCHLCSITWAGDCSCPGCALKDLEYQTGQDEVNREIHGVNMNNVFISGTVSSTPQKVKRGKSTLYIFTLHNKREEKEIEKKIWIEVIWEAPPDNYMKDLLVEGAKVLVKGCLGSTKKAKGFILSIKADEVELI
jgi:hypothetical protein